MNKTVPALIAAAALAAANPTRAMSFAEVLAMPAEAQTAYVVGVMDRWAIDPRNLECQNALSGRQLVEGVWKSWKAASIEPQGSRSDVRQVPAALFLELELSNLCRAAKKN